MMDQMTCSVNGYLTMWRLSVATQDSKLPMLSMNIFRYTANGSNCATVPELCKHLKIAKTTLKDRVKALKDVHGTKHETDSSILQKLKGEGSVAMKAQSVTVVKLDVVIRAMESILSPMLYQALTLFRSAVPSPQVHLRGRTQDIVIPKLKASVRQAVSARQDASRGSTLASDSESSEERGVSRSRVTSIPRPASGKASPLNLLTKTAFDSLGASPQASARPPIAPSLSTEGLARRHQHHLMKPQEATRENLLRMGELAGARTSQPRTPLRTDKQPVAGIRTPFKPPDGSEYVCHGMFSINGYMISYLSVAGAPRSLDFARSPAARPVPVVFDPTSDSRPKPPRVVPRVSYGPAPSISSVYGQPFPTQLDSTVLHIADLDALYGLKKDQVLSELQAEIDYFRVWSMQPVQLDRPQEYVRAVQTVTFDGQADCLRGYFGFVFNYCGRSLSEVSIRAYEEPQTFVSFISFLKARGCRKGQLVKHISLAKKVNSYISTALSENDQVGRAHHTKLQACFGTLETQISLHMRDVTERVIPDWTDIHSWVDRLGEGAKAVVRIDRPGPLSTLSAISVQAAIVAMLVTGRYTGAPCRLSTIKSVIHPSFVKKVGACRDADCLDRKSCPGNHFVIMQPTGDGDGDSCKRVKFIIPHHKNDREQGMSGAPIEYMLPAASLLNKLLVLHIEEGHDRITSRTRMVEPHLFVDSYGRGMDSAKGRFTSYWRTLMKHTVSPTDLPPFAPSLARRSFVEWYTAETGALPYLWDGTADIMGNSVGQFLKTYNSSFKKRRMQDTVDDFNMMMDRDAPVWNDGLDDE